MKRKKLIIFILIIMVIGISSIAIWQNRVILKMTTYHYPYKETIKIKNNGKIYKSKIIDELTIDGAPKDKFTYTKKITKNDLKKTKKKL